MSQKTEELVGTISSVTIPRVNSSYSRSGRFVIGNLSDKSCIIGVLAEDDSLIPGVTYRFFGQWETSDRYGKQFRFKAYTQQEPNSRRGVVEYLRRYCPWVGETTAHRLVDTYGAEGAIAALKTNPQAVSRAIRGGLTPERAMEASVELKRIEQFQETRVKLLDLFAKRRIREEVIDLCIKRFGVHAPERIRRDPWCLLVYRMPGCGFLTVDNLYLELGHSPRKLKRVAICCWNALETEPNGSTWMKREAVLQAVRDKIAGVSNAERALTLAVRAGWVVEKRVKSSTGEGTGAGEGAGNDVQVWCATTENADCERIIAERTIFDEREGTDSDGASEEEVEQAEPGDPVAVDA